MDLQIMGTRLQSCRMDLENITSFDIETQMGSCQFVKTVMPLAIATIMHRRCDFNRDYIKDHVAADVPYVGFRSTIPKGHCVHHLAATSQKMQEMIEKKYLKNVKIYIQDKTTDIIHESYEFVFKYRDDDDGKLRRSTTAYNVAAKFFAGINQLPNKNRFNENDINILVEWSLFDSTPDAVVAKGFRPVAFPPIDNDLQHFHLATLKTKFHTVSLTVASVEDHIMSASQNVTIEEIDTIEAASASPSPKQAVGIEPPRDSECFANDDKDNVDSLSLIGKSPSQSIIVGKKRSVELSGENKENREPPNKRRLADVKGTVTTDEIIDVEASDNISEDSVFNDVDNWDVSLCGSTQYNTAGDEPVADTHKDKVILL